MKYSMFGESVASKSCISIGLFFTLLLLPFTTISPKPKGAHDLILKGIEQLNHACDQWDKEGFAEALRIFQQSSETATDEHLPFYWKGVAFFHLAIFHLFGRDQDRDQAQGEVCVDEGIQIPETRRGPE